MAATDASASRGDGVKRVYTKADVERLRGSIKIEHTLARLGAERLWNLLHSEDYVHALGCLTGAQAVQCVAGGEPTALFAARSRAPTRESANNLTTRRSS